MGVREALAAVATSAETLRTMREDPMSFQDRFALSDADMRTLGGVSADHYDFMAREVRAKHLVRLGVVLPRTVADLEARHGELVDAFMADMAAAGGGDEPAGGELAAERLLTFGELPAGLVDFGWFELDQYRLLRDPTAAAAAGRVSRRTGGPSRTEPVEDHGWWAGKLVAVSLTARVASYDHDVTHPGAPRELPAERVDVVLQRVWAQPLRTYRIGSGLALLLGYCDGSRTAPQVAEAAGVPPDQAFAALTGLVEHDLVTLAPRRRRAGHHDRL
ncbi:hypothetical protein [Streptomyces wuyuanensis]|uniref:hypothetical protein n=1 Tax=Streptomyces wuyuanensis TaxID=1196353 RepID=UPI0034135DF5